MKKLAFFSTIIVFSFTIFNVYSVLNYQKSLKAPLFSLQKALADGEGGEEKWVKKVDCTCDNGKSGFSLDCTTEQTEYETCTTDPLTECYRMAGFPPEMVMCKHPA
jgi:hypothetical protein